VTDKVKDKIIGAGEKLVGYENIVSIKGFGYQVQQFLRYNRKN